MTTGLKAEERNTTRGRRAAGTIENARPVADEPRAPRRIALVRASADAGLGFLLEDFRAAYAAYSRLAGCELPEFETMELGTGTIAGAGAETDSDAHTGGGVGAADGVVFSCAGTVDAEALDRLACLLKPGSRLHAIIDLPGFDPTGANETTRRLRGLCTRREALWGGGVTFAGDRPFDALRHSPRMGLLRRPFSETMDMLVGSVRMGCSIRRSQELGGADVGNFDELGLVRATPALPSTIWNLVMYILGQENHKC